ncbi:ssDNA/RNA exonuclease, 3' - 5' specific [Campylobacter avium LMG 24591]|uniref:SsDNA/RNA exonuclease, 3'-5' specific n=1 Tax=Campylobacter avium LMG 24591 TaxID=522484 RepID=A0A222MYH9_9BACT|nr:TatD family hydrolase [Campylobacter avium]ASQ30656.1 ssDNA/RNA exonuclease, 3' - 5' specific [Campylobacter avium LMG 24591]OYD79752.1 ssDNA/RNA exonuclease, 3' - 5' specific [Campylobacter avium]
MFLDTFKHSAKIIDTHCHLDDESYYDDLHELLLACKTNNIEKMIIPGADIKDLSRAVELCQRYDELYFAVGVHPYHCKDYDEKLLRFYINHEKCVAVGECGLDYFRLKADDVDEKKLQKEVFLAQISLAKEFKKPLIIHAREANEDVYQILSSHASSLYGGVLHCFNASPLLLNLKDNGFYFGIGGVLTFKNAKALLEILPKIPRDKLLLETDAPYLSPEPFRGTRNTPINTHLVADKMATLLNLDRNELINICTKNANTLFFQEVV